MAECKIVMLGSSGIGKSAMTIQFVQRCFVEEYDGGIEDSFRKQVLIDDETATIEILDTVGSDEFLALRDQWIRTGHGFILAYSKTDAKSFEEIMSIHEKVLQVKDSDSVPMVLCGCKADLHDQEKVTFEQGQAVAKEWRIPFFEISSPMSVNVDEAFCELVRLIRRNSHTVK